MVFGSMIFTGAAIVFISFLAFGYETWQAFFVSLPYAMEIIESGGLVPHVAAEGGK